MDYYSDKIPDDEYFNLIVEPKRKYVCFIYNIDEDVFKVSASLIKLLDPKSSIVAIDDGINQCTENLMKFCSENNIKYRQTLFNRGGNFVGTEACIGLAKCLYEESQDCDTLIKYDADTLIIRYDWIKRLEQDRLACFCGAYMNNHDYAAGGAYAIKSKVCKELYEDEERYRPFRTAIENYEVSCRLFRIGSQILNKYNLNPDRSVIRYSCSENQGFVMGNPTKGSPQQIVNIVRWMTFGYDYTSATSNQDKARYKKDQLKKMLEVYNYCKDLVLKKIKENKESKDKEQESPK